MSKFSPHFRLVFITDLYGETKIATAGFVAQFRGTRGREPGRKEGGRCTEGGSRWLGKRDSQGGGKRER